MPLLNSTDKDLLSRVAEVNTDPDVCRLYSMDILSEGHACLAVVTPHSTEALSKAVALATSAGYAVGPRGGGMSYTGGYTPQSDNTLMFDLSKLDRIIEINTENMYVTVEAGVTWKSLSEALAQHGLRTPFMGPLSGARATVGGNLSQGGLFLGSARYGTSADGVLGLEVILADGTAMKTGQAAFRNGKPFYRNYGPDLTGIFLNDCGALGIKSQATLKLIQLPATTGFASFAFSSVADAANAMSNLARSGLTEECYCFDEILTQKSLENSNLKNDLRTLWGILRSQGSIVRGFMETVKVMFGGRKFAAGVDLSVHIVCSGMSQAGVNEDLASCRRIVRGHRGKEITNTIPKAIRGFPFPPLNSVLGPKGQRMAPLHAKVPHSDGQKLIAAAQGLLKRHSVEMADSGVEWGYMLVCASHTVFLFEPVLLWPDKWLPLHRHVAEEAHLSRLTEPEENRRARDKADFIATELIDLFADWGAAHTQIGRTYPYAKSMNPETLAFVKQLKHTVDPRGLMNPGSLGL